jgi:hypothetical protein
MGEIHMQKTGNKSKLLYSLDGTTEWTELGKFEKITGGKAKAAEVKTTTLDSDAEERQPGLVDYQPISAILRYAAAMTTTIKGWMDNQTMLFFKVELNEGATTKTSETVAGYIDEFDPFGELNNNNEILSSITIARSGKPTFAAGT